MDNQHRKIDGYRELDQNEIDLINEIKRKGAELQGLIDKVVSINQAYPDQQLLMDSEAPRWAAQAKTSLQNGIMQLTRSVAKPLFF